MEQLILEYICRREYASFVELCRNIEGFSGSVTLSIEEHPSLVVWVGVSPEAATALKRLLLKQHAYMYESDPLAYTADGGGMKFDIAKRLSDYKFTRWFPVVFTSRKNKSIRSLSHIHLYSS